MMVDLWPGNLAGCSYHQLSSRISETDKWVVGVGPQPTGHMQRTPMAFSIPKGPSRKVTGKFSEGRVGWPAESLMFYMNLHEWIYRELTLYRNHSGSPGPQGLAMPFSSRTNPQTLQGHCQAERSHRVTTGALF